MFGDDWRTLFDIIIVNARKPSFFSAKNRHFRVYSPKTGRLKWQRVLNLQRGKIYSGVSFFGRCLLNSDFTNFFVLFYRETMIVLKE